MASLIVGPMLRYVGETDATLFVETDEPCEVEVLGHRARTFHVSGHHYALVVVDGLKPGAIVRYEMRLDGRLVWPEPESPFPPPTIRTVDPSRTVRLSFGSCRAAAPHEPPYTLEIDEHPKGRGIDALCALTERLKVDPVETWPDGLLLIGDQVYADEPSDQMLEFIESRRDTSVPPGHEAADFEEYTALYRESFTTAPAVRWVLSTISTSMIFDDHDVRDDWNISEAWVRDMRALGWWDERIVGALMSYWIYQHIGNLSPSELGEYPIFQAVQNVDDAGPMLREFAYRADRFAEENR